jgi:hypothetical protein
MVLYSLVLTPSLARIFVVLALFSRSLYPRDHLEV